MPSLAVHHWPPVQTVTYNLRGPSGAARRTPSEPHPELQCSRRGSTMEAYPKPPTWSLRASYTFIFFDFLTSSTQTTCYNPWAGYWIGFYPCSTDQGIQSCCEVYELCLSNYTCLGDFGYYQAPCTDPEYKAPACVQGACAGCLFTFFHLWVNSWNQS